MTYASIYAAAPFLPLEAIDKKVNEGYIGLMLSSYAIASVVAGFYTGDIIMKIGRRRSLFISNILQMIAAFGTAFIHYIDDKTIFITAFILTRVVWGISLIINQTASKLV